MLKLTRFDDKARDMWISPKYIVAISDTHEATYITTVNGVCAVVETIEQILAMPEMMEALYPSVYVGPMQGVR